MKTVSGRVGKKDKVNWITSIALIIFHVGAIAALFMFSWKAFAITAALYWIAIGFGIGQIGLRRPALRVRPIDLAIEADADLLEVERRSMFCARGEANIGAVEPGVEILGPDAPVRREGVLHACARHPAAGRADPSSR